MRDLQAIRDNLKRVNLLVCDVDGVFTDGSIYIGESGEFKRFSVRDGMGVALARLTPLRMALLSGRHSEATLLRARELQLGDQVYQGYLNKIVALKKILKQFQVTPEETAYVGDDYVDIPVMKAVGVSFAVPNARDRVKEIADYTLNTPGGQGAVTEVVEIILEARGELEDALAEMERDIYMVDESL